MIKMEKVKVPILNIDTFADTNDIEDVKVAIVEAVLSFCIVAEKMGLGITEELKRIKKEK
jgi:hypothetical protein